MFSILDNPSATTEEMAKAYVAIESFRRTVKEKCDDAQRKVVELRQKALSGKEDKKQMQQAVSELSEVQLDLDACDLGLTRLTAKIQERIPIEARNRIQKTIAENQELQLEQARVIEKFLREAAKVYVLYESIYGPRTIYYQHTGDVKPDFPKLIISTNSNQAGYSLKTEQYKFYETCVEQERQNAGNGDSVPLETRKNLLSKERIDLEKMLMDLNPETAASTLIEKYRSQSAGARQDGGPENNGQRA